MNLFSLEKCCLQGKLIKCFKIFNGFTNVDSTKLLVMDIDDSTQMRNDGTKLKCSQVHSDCTKFFITNTVVQDWNRLPPSVVQFYLIASFKNNLDYYLVYLNLHQVSFNVMVAIQKVSLRFRADQLVWALIPVWSGNLCM